MLGPSLDHFFPFSVLPALLFEPVVSLSELSMEGPSFKSSDGGRSFFPKRGGARLYSKNEESASFTLRNLSKLILPPLGATDYNRAQLSSRGRIISPMDSRYRCWETFTVILVAYSAWVYPFEVAFMDASPKGGLYIADNIVNIFFAIDIVLTFFMAYIDSRTQLLVLITVFN